MNFNTFSTLYGVTIATSSFSGSGYTSSLVQAAQDLDFTITIISGSSLGDELQITSSFGSLITHSLTTSSFNERTSSVALTDATPFQNVLVQGTVQGVNATTPVIFASPISGAVSMNVVTVVPTGSYSVGPVSGSLSGSDYYLDTPNNPIGLLQYAINNVEEGDSNPTGSLCLRLPAPSTGQTVIVNNNTPRNLRVFTSSSMGRFTEGSTTIETTRNSSSAYILPPGPNSATFECVQNPTQGVWNVTFPPGTTQDVVCEFHIDHVSGSGNSQASFNITPNSSDPYQNRAMKVRVEGVYDTFTGDNTRPLVRYFETGSVENNFNIGGYHTEGGQGQPGAIYPNTTSSDPYYISPTEVRDPNDFFTQFADPYTYIDRIQLHTNITSSDYFQPGGGYDDGGLHVIGTEKFTSPFPQSGYPFGVMNYTTRNYLFNPTSWRRDVYIDENIAQLVSSGQVAPQNAFELERKSSNTNPNNLSEVNRVVPSQNPPPYDPSNPQIGALHTEYFDTNENPNNPINTNPVPAGALNGRSMIYIREQIPGTNDYVDTNRYFSPTYSFYVSIPSWYATKTYKFRMITTVRIA